MKDLQRYNKYFTQPGVYTRYRDKRYKKIKDLTGVFRSDEAYDEIMGPLFDRFIKYIQPVVAVKDYKSQTGFPESQLGLVVKCMADIKRTNYTKADCYIEMTELFEKVVSDKHQKTGFDFPTATAVFHFCQPRHFPIVDEYVENACFALYTKREFGEMKIPDIPSYGALAATKSARYRDFIVMLGKIRKLQKEQHGNSWGYRELDKALMVYGNEDLRKKAQRKYR